MLSLAGDANNDLMLDATGDIAILRDLDALIEDVKCACRALRGEMRYAKDEGVPYFETVWEKQDFAAFEFALRATILAVPNVTSIDSLTIVRVPGTDTLAFEAQINSAFGRVTI